ncbi:hypothetical protein GF385_01390, partial [Candidatus Dependentiae bacterium]|nr:hypothetical protein [Candidatus Dependentiae bacterium]
MVVSKNVTILGAGAFGTSISTILAENGYKVLLWCHESELVDYINNDHINKLFFPDFKLNENIMATNSFEKALSHSKYIFQAIPVKFLRKVLLNAKNFVKKEHVFISLSKGMENESLFLPSQIINELFENKVAVLSGPNFAKEIAQKKYTASVLASDDEDLGIELKKILQNNYFNIELSNDVIGVQVGAALKNLVSVLVGFAKGSKAAENTIALLITKSFKEIVELCKILGGNE